MPPTLQKYDGKDVHVTGRRPYDTISIKQVNANTLTDARRETGGPYHATSRLVVSKGGKTMTTTQRPQYGWQGFHQHFRFLTNNNGCVGPPSAKSLSAPSLSAPGGPIPVLAAHTIARVEFRPFSPAAQCNWNAERVLHPPSSASWLLPTGTRGREQYLCNCCGRIHPAGRFHGLF